MQTAVPVDDVDREEKCLRPQLEVIMDLDKPINERRPDCLIDLLLLQHVGRIGIPFFLHPEHVLVDLLAKLGHVIYVTERSPVYSLDLTEDLVLASLVEHLQLLVQTDSGQLLAG